MKVSRRTFMKYTAGSTLLTLFGFDKLSGISKALAQIPGGSLDPSLIPKYATPLLIPPVMPAAGRTAEGGQEVDYYEIAMRQFAQQILPAGLPPTTVWGYGAVKSRKQEGGRIHNAPSLTIEARWKRPVRIKWINELMDANGNYLPHLLPVDPDAALGQPARWHAGRDTRPTFTARRDVQRPGADRDARSRRGGVGDESDGYAEAWYLPDAKNIPAGLRDRGHLVRLLRRKASPSSAPPGALDLSCSSTRTTAPRRSGITITRSA